MRIAAFAARTAALVLAPFVFMAAATAQAPEPQATQPPLMTAPRSDDKATTDPTASPSGVSGAAPSDEMQRVAPPVTPTAQATQNLSAAQAQALIGKEVRTRDGQPWGEIRDFTLAGPDGRIERIVLASGGFLGIGTKLVSVPASTLRVDAPNVEPGTDKAAPTNATLDLDPADLAEAPEFNYKDGERTLVGKP